jgi:predicted RNA-binding protein with RPS1 domain
MKIIKINEREKKIGLSIKAVQAGRVPEGAGELPRAQAAETSTTMGDAFRAARSADADKDKDKDEDEE